MLGCEFPSRCRQRACPAFSKQAVDLISEGFGLGSNCHKISVQPARSGQIRRHDAPAGRQILQRLKRETTPIEWAISIGNYADVYSAEIARQDVERLGSDPTHISPTR